MRQEIAAALGSVWDGYLVRRYPVHNPPPFIRSKEESPVFHDRSAEGASELVLFVIRPAEIQIALRIKHLVSKELINASVPAIGPGLGNDINYRAGVASVLGVERIGKDAKFSNTVRRRLNGGRIDEQIIAFSAVDIEVVGPTAAAID